MRMTLPLLKVEYKDGNVIKTESETNVEVISSIACQINWEDYFPALAEKMALTDYIERYRNIPIEYWNSATCVSVLKVLFCILKFEKALSFFEFCNMFNFGDAEYFSKFISRIDEIMEYAFPDSKKKD